MKRLLEGLTKYEKIMVILNSIKILVGVIGVLLVVLTQFHLK